MNLDPVRIAAVAAVVAAVVALLSGAAALAVTFGALAVAWISVPMPQSETSRTIVRLCAAGSIVASLLVAVLVAL